MGKRSSFDRVTRHLRNSGAETPAPEALYQDLDSLLRRYDELQSLDQAFGTVELSPYLKSLLRVSGMEGHAALAGSEELRTTAVAGG